MPRGTEGRTATIRYDTKAQLLRFKEAARATRRSLNVFTLLACQKFADYILNENQQNEVAYVRSADLNPRSDNQ